MLLHLFGEEPVVVERGAHSLEKRLKRRVVAQFATGGRFENRQAGVLGRLGKRGVESDDADLIAREKLMNHECELVATPRPVSLGLEASFVDVHDHDAWIAHSWQEQTDPRVVDPTFELSQSRNLDPARGVGQQTSHQRQFDRNPNDATEREFRHPADDGSPGNRLSEREA